MTNTEGVGEMTTYRTPATTLIARDVTRLIEKGMKQIDICRKLKISRGRCRYYAVGAGTYKPKELRHEKICGNDLARRNTPEAYKAYMKKNPHYFENLSQGKSLDVVCAETMRLRRAMRRGEAEFFLDGLPQGDGDSALFSIGYGDR